MSLAVAPVSPGPVGGASSPSSATKASAPAPHFASSADQFAGSSGKKGSTANLGLISGALACCAIVPFLMGMLVIGGVTLAARRAFKGISHLQVPHAA